MDFLGPTLALILDKKTAICNVPERFGRKIKSCCVLVALITKIRSFEQNQPLTPTRISIHLRLKQEGCALLLSHRTNLIPLDPLTNLYPDIPSH